MDFRLRARAIVTLLASILIVGSFSAMTAFAATQAEADAYLAEEEWAKAAEEYRDLLKADPDNTNNWFSLGRALDHLEAYEDTLEAYQKALDTGFTTPLRLYYRLARTYMHLDDHNKALDQLEKLAEIGGINFRTVESAEEFAPLQDEPRFQNVVEALRPCQDIAFRHFDFWLGQWDVTPAGSTEPTATNKISSTYDGCVVLEEYTAGAFTGTSLSFYDSVQDKWHQTWMSNAGGALYIEGGLNDAGAMVLSDKDLPISETSGTVNRTTWMPQTDGTVRQLWENSTDKGETWTVVFDGMYKRQAAP